MTSHHKPIYLPSVCEDAIRFPRTAPKPVASTSKSPPDWPERVVAVVEACSQVSLRGPLQSRPITFHIPQPVARGTSRAHYPRISPIRSTCFIALGGRYDLRGSAAIRRIIEIARYCDLPKASCPVHGRSLPSTTSCLDVADDEAPARFYAELAPEPERHRLPTAVRSM